MANTKRKSTRPQAGAQDQAARSLRVDLGGGTTGANRVPTIEEIRRRFGPPKTYGCPEEARVAMDEALMGAGAYTLLQHTWDMGQMPLPQFMGYGSLQSIAQNGMIRACVSTVADDLTRNWIEIQREGEAEEENGGGEDILTRITAAMDDLKVQRVFHEAAELTGYEGGCLVFIDTGEENLSLPLNITRSSRELRPGGRLRFVPIDPVNVFPGNYNSVNPLRPDYYRPTTWWVMGMQVHASRLLRIVANEVPILLKPNFNFLGIPQAQILWDYVAHFNECRTAVSRLLTKFSLTVFKTKLLEGTTLGSSQMTNLDRRIQFMVANVNNDGVLAVDKEAEDVVKVSTSLGGCVDIVRQSLEFLAAVNRTPAVKLLGISPSGFNATGESDLRNYYDHIAAMQRKIFEDPLKTVLDCLQLHVAGRIDPAITFSFRPLSEEDKASAATLRKTTADTIAVYLDRDVISAEEARKRLSDDPESGFQNLDPDDLPEPTVTPADLASLPGYGKNTASLLKATNQEGGNAPQGEPGVETPSASAPEAKPESEGAEAAETAGTAETDEEEGRR